MVIQSNMSPKEILQVWENTGEVFEKYNIQISQRKLEDLVDELVLPKLLSELNDFVGSSSATCIEGG